MRQIVVAGGGLAGFQAVRALRKQGYDGNIVMLGAEKHPPYDRPPLSKAILRGDRQPTVDPALPFDADALAVDLRLGVAATGLSGGPDGGVVETDAGPVPYDGLVIATGSEPIRLPGEGARYLRTRDDALVLRSLMREGVRVVLVGAGWIGAEVATSAAVHGCLVTVVEQAKAPVAHAVPPAVGAAMTSWYAEAGVELITGERVERVRPTGVELAGGRSIEADVVVVGVGVRPATGWLEGSGVALDKGVLTGADLRTSLPRVVAAGDVTARWSPRYETRIRGEHWDDAMRSPAVAVANLLAELVTAGSGEAEVYDPVPYVWSEQFGRMVTYAGVVPSAQRDAARLLWRGDPESERAWTVFWLNPANQVAAVLAVDRPRDFVHGRRLAGTGVAVDPARLADTRIPVRDAVAG